jgi:adenylate cyclase
MVVGNIGSDLHFAYTVIGDEVNLGARLEGVNKEYGTQILISETTRAQIGSQFLLRPIDEVELRGKKKKIKLFELMALQEEATEGQKELALLFTQAYNDHQEGHFAEARRQFQAILKKFPTDAPTQLYLEKLKF